MTAKAKSQGVSFDSEQVARAITVATLSDIPLIIVGKPGIGKTATVKQTIRRFPGDWDLITMLLSDKEPTDIGGIPFPNPSGTGMKYLVMDRLPFGQRYEPKEKGGEGRKAVVFFDEIDRSDTATQNAAQQLFIERNINGNSLGSNVRLVGAMNGVTDIGTTPLSEALRNRCCFVTMRASYDSWENWASDSEINPVLMAFAKNHPEVWANGALEPEVEELAVATPRSWEYVDKIIKTTREVNFKTQDIVRGMVSGLVGNAAATEFYAFYDLFSKAPSVDEIIANPSKTPIPDRPDILSSLTIALTEAAKERENDSDEKRGRARQNAGRIAEYGLRWEHEEPQSYLMRRLLEKQPHVKLSDHFQAWENGRLTLSDRQKGFEVDPTQAARLAPISKAMNGKVLPDNEEWVNRIQISSESGSGMYVISQRRSNMEWACSCPGWRTRRQCKHLEQVQEVVKANNL